MGSHEDQSDALGSAAAPSGKSAATENFPVASHLIERSLRPHVMVFYRFARTIDDVADHPSLPAEEKLERLRGFEAAIKGEPVSETRFAVGHQCRQMLERAKITPEHCLNLIDAFKQDAVKPRYASWSELIDYCDRSAAPVGRFLLDLHGESRSGYAASDALCNALQVINHLQDVGEDLAEMDRCYVPEDWLAEVGESTEAFRRDRLSDPARGVLTRMLDGVSMLLDQADTLPSALKSRRLSMESAVILNIAHRLTGELRRRDPLAERVKLNKADVLGELVSGVASGWFSRRPAKDARMGAQVTP